MRPPVPTSPLSYYSITRGCAVNEDHPPSVLIAEASDVFRRHLVGCLSERDRYEILEATDEVEVRHLLDARPDRLDVVLLSLLNFKQKGLRILRLVKEVTPEVEVILLTPSEDLSLALSMEGMRLGAFDDLLIPFDVEMLGTRVAEALERKASRALSRGRGTDSGATRAGERR